MISQPPTNSPLTKSWGNVGQLENWGKLALISGLVSISTNEKGFPQAIKICEAFDENPHWGESGEPFMYKSTGFSLTCCSSS